MIKACLTNISSQFLKTLPPLVEHKSMQPYWVDGGNFKVMKHGRKSSLLTWDDNSTNKKFNKKWIFISSFL